MVVTQFFAFPNAKVIGCFFNYSQALVHNAKKYKILKGDKEELEWNAIKLLISLALLSEVFIEEGFYIIAKVIFDKCTYLDAFFNYYKETWINNFKPSSFCVYKQLHRTNNISERHNRESKESLRKHSTIITFLANQTEHQKEIYNTMRHPTFWTRSDFNSSLKKKEEALKEIWAKIENNEDLDLLLILYELLKLIGKEEINA